MQEARLGSGPLRLKDPRREAMLEPEEVSAIVRLNRLGWGARWIARELGISRNTVRGYIAAGGWTPYRQPRRKKALDGQESWLRERLRRHRGNADVIRQELAAEKGITVCSGRRYRVIDPAHFEGLTGFRPSRSGEVALSPVATPAPALLRPLGEYEAILGGSF